MITKILLLTSLLSLATVAHAGDRRGNGGDATAQSFMSVMRKVYLFLEENPRVAIKASRLEAKKNVKLLQNSLGNASKVSLIEVTLKRPKDEFGVEKAAVTTLNPLKIFLHKESWEQSKNVNLEQVKEDQVTLAAMELLLLSGVSTDRYKIAKEQMGSRYTEVLAMTEEEKPGIPAFPESAMPLKTRVTGKEYIVFDDAYVQALKNTTFKDCVIDIELTETSWFVNFSRPTGEAVFRIAKGFESVNGKRIYWDNNKTIRMLHNAVAHNGGVATTTFDEPIQGLISYTSVLSEDETEVKSIEFSSYLLKNVNRGTPLKPKYELVFEEVLTGRGCHR